MSEFAYGDPHMNKIYFGKIRDNNILRTDDIEGNYRSWLKFFPSLLLFKVPL